MMTELMRYTCEEIGVSRNGGDWKAKLSRLSGSEIKPNGIAVTSRRDNSSSSSSERKKMRYAVLVTGPAGAGKSTFCASFMTHLHTSKRTGHLVNLDPAAAPDSFEYAPSIDIKDLISVGDVMSELGYGPNGGLVYCFEYVSAPFACF
jgi:GTPase SAR1 family protein